jgi:hypothetical protein
MSKQTAVEYLQNELWSNYEFKSSKQKREFVSKIEQAKAMEKEQMVHCYEQAYREGYIDNGKSGNQYFNENYGGDK